MFLRESFCWPAGLNNIRRMLVTTTQLRIIKKCLVRIAIANYRTALYFTHCPIFLAVNFHIRLRNTRNICKHNQAIMHIQYLLILIDKTAFASGYPFSVGMGIQLIFAARCFAECVCEMRREVVFSLGGLGDGWMINLHNPHRTSSTALH